MARTKDGRRVCVARNNWLCRVKLYRMLHMKVDFPGPCEECKLRCGLAGGRVFESLAGVPFPDNISFIEDHDLIVDWPPAVLRS